MMMQEPLDEDTKKKNTKKGCEGEFSNNTILHYPGSLSKKGENKRKCTFEKRSITYKMHCIRAPKTVFLLRQEKWCYRS